MNLDTFTVFTKIVKYNMKNYKGNYTKFINDYKYKIQNYKTSRR